MEKLKQLWSSIQSNTLLRRSLTAIFAILMVLILLRACNGRIVGAPNFYRIAADGTWYPLQLMGKEKNMMAFSDELLTAIGKEENFRAQLSVVQYRTLFEELEGGKYDGILSSLTPNVVTREKYRFSDPFYLLGPVLIVPVSSPVHSLEEMGGKTIGIKSGSSVVFNIEKYPSIIIVPYDNANDAVDSLLNNQIDGVIMEAMPAYVAVQGFYVGKLKVASNPLTLEGLRLVANLSYRHSEDMIDRFNEGLKAVHESGVYDALLEKWGLINTELHE